MSHSTPGDPPEALQPNQRAFLAAFQETGIISRACAASGVGRTSHYRWLEEDEAYATAFERAQEIAGDTLEEEAVRRARDGVQKLKFYGTQLVTVPDPDHPEDPEKRIPYVEHEYSDTLLIFLLKGAKPEKYRERSDVRSEVNGKVTVEAVTVDI